MNIRIGIITYLSLLFFYAFTVILRELSKEPFYVKSISVGLLMLSMISVLMAIKKNNKEIEEND